MSEKKFTPKNKWSRIFRKRWFFPSLYLAIAALLLAGVIWYQNSDSEVTDVADENTENEVSENYEPTPNDEDAEPVVEQQELTQMPVTDQENTEIVTKFYDYDASTEDQEAALVFHNNRYYQSTGIDIASKDEETFDVVASLSGVVNEVKEDPLLGNVVVLTHENEVMTYYASLGEVSVTAGDEVKQGETLGTAGKNIFGKDNGNHVHFEIRKDGQSVNPESFFNQPFSALEKIEEESTEEVSEGSEQEAEGTEEEASDEATSEESAEEEANEDTESDDESDDENTDVPEDDSDDEETETPEDDA